MERFNSVFQPRIITAPAHNSHFEASYDSQSTKSDYTSHMSVDPRNFDCRDYLWLFDKELKFSKR